MINLPLYCLGIKKMLNFCLFAHAIAVLIKRARLDAKTFAKEFYLAHL
jgi:hypothetical protein